MAKKTKTTRKSTYSNRTDFASFMQERAEIKREYFFMLPLLLAVFGLMMLGGSFASQSPIVDFVSAPGQASYHIVRENGETQNFGANELSFEIETESEVVAVERAAGGGYWVLTNDGRVQALDGAEYHGAVDGVASSRPVDLIAHPTLQVYRIVTADGAVYSFGGATIAGSENPSQAEEPILAGISTQSGNGYWLITASGKVFSYGDAIAIDGPARALTATRGLIDGFSVGKGMILVDNRGTIYAYETALSPCTSLQLNPDRPSFVAVELSADKQGCWFIDEYGSILSSGLVETLQPLY